MQTTGYDIVIVGAGSGGVSLASTLASAGRRVALVSAGLVGGECPYVACMPSKSLLRSARARTEARQLVEHGGAGHRVDVGDDRAAWEQALRRRDDVANQRDDSHLAASLRDQGIEVIRGFGVLTGAGRVEAAGRELRATHVVIDTGSVPVIPEIDGLDTVNAWTSDEALTNRERPGRLLMLGGGPIGCELAQAYSAFGTHVTIIDTSGRLLPNEDPVISEAMMTIERDAGVQLELNATPERLEPDGDGIRMHLHGGGVLRGDRLLLVVGRKPAIEGLNIELAGARITKDGSIEIDERCRAADGLWAIGDVTGIAPYTHTANQQARVAADAILDRTGHSLIPDALPRAVFTDPPLAATGLTAIQAQDRGLNTAVVDVDLADVSRAGAEGEGPLGPGDSSGGVLRLVADRATRLLVGAAAVGPNADSWITEATIAIRAGISVEVLADVVRPFPTYSEAFTIGYDRLLEALNARPKF